MEFAEDQVPTYQYACTECEHSFEQVQSFTEDSLTVCPQCEGRLRKVFNAVGVVFKGSGFYRTDSRADKRSGSANGSTNGTAKSADSTSSSGSSDSGSSSSGTSSTTSSSTGSGSSGSGSKAGATSAA